MEVVRDEVFAGKVGSVFGDYVGSVDQVSTRSSSPNEPNGTRVEVHLFVRSEQLVAYVGGEGKLGVAAATMDRLLPDLQAYACSRGYPDGPRIVFTGTRWQ